MIEIFFLNRFQTKFTRLKSGVYSGYLVAFLAFLVLFSVTIGSLCFLLSCRKSELFFHNSFFDEFQTGLPKNCFSLRNEFMRNAYRKNTDEHERFLMFCPISASHTPCLYLLQEVTNFVVKTCVEQCNSDLVWKK